MMLNAPTMSIITAANAIHPTHAVGCVLPGVVIAVSSSSQVALTVGRDTSATPPPARVITRSGRDGLDESQLAGAAQRLAASFGTELAVKARNVRLHRVLGDEQ